MKKYIRPVMEAGSIQETNMLAASLPIGEGTVDGGDALGKKNDWNIWSGDKEEDM